MIKRAKGLIAWTRNQSADSLFVLAVMIIMEIVMLPLAVCIVIWIYASRLLKSLVGRFAIKR